MPKGNFKRTQWRWNKNIKLWLHLQQTIGSFKMHHAQNITNVKYNIIAKKQMVKKSMKNQWSCRKYLILIKIGIWNMYLVSQIHCNIKITFCLTSRPNCYIFHNNLRPKTHKGSLRVQCDTSQLHQRKTYWYDSMYYWQCHHIIFAKNTLYDYRTILYICYIIWHQQGSSHSWSMKNWGPSQ